MDSARFFTSFKNVNFSNVDIIHHGINKIKNINLKKKEKKYCLLVS